MTYVETQADGDCLFEGNITFDHSGRYGYTLRILPHHEDLSNPYEPRLIMWAGGA